MGVIIRQGSYNAIFTYIGILIGFINTILIFPNFLSTEEYGLTRVIISAGTLLAQFSALGIDKSTIKFFPYFKTDDKKHNGFIFLLFFIPLLGFLLISGFTLLFKYQIINWYSQKAKLFAENYHLVYILSGTLVFLLAFDAYSRAILKTVFPLFLNKILLRILWLFEVLAYHFNFINFFEFLWLFVLSYAVVLFILQLYLIIQNEINFHFQLPVIKKSFRDEMIKFSLFIILSAGSMYIVNQIDIIMLGAFAGLTNTAIYAVAYYIAGIIQVPAISVNRVATSLLADAWKNNNINKIKEIYFKTSINNFVTASLIFLIIWFNIENIFSLLPEKYSNGKIVVLFIALAKLFDVLSGINAGIIQTSAFYKADFYTNLLLSILAVLTNYFFIPLWGINGAALATFISIIIYNSIRIIIIYKKIQYIPFNKKTFISICFLLFFFGISLIIPHFKIWWIDIVIRTFLISFIYLLIIYYFKISEDINLFVLKLLKKRN